MTTAPLSPTRRSAARASATPAVEPVAGAERGELARFSADNSLADVDAALPLAVAARLCREHGYLFPLPRPLPPLSLVEACARLPFLVDAYVASADAVTPEGLLLSTGNAPRAATGPDLLGALCSRPPLASAVRVRLRVLDATSARRTVERVAGAAAAAERVARLLDDGRAFAVLATKAEDGFVVRAVGGPASLPGADPAVREPFADGGLRRVASARSLVPGDVTAMRRHLDDGASLAAAPLMGRVAALSSAPPREHASEHEQEGAASFARALVRAGARRG